MSSKRKAEDDSFNRPDSKRQATTSDESFSPSSTELSASQSSAEMSIERRPQPQQQPSENKRSNQIDHSMLESIFTRINRPIPMIPMSGLVVDTTGFNTYSLSLRNTLINLLYPGQDVPENMITEAQFRLVVRYIIRSRIDCVYSKVTGRRPEGRIAIPSEYPVPRALSIIVNDIGRTVLQRGGIVVIPQPEPLPVDQAQRLTTQVTFEMLSSFNLLIEACFVRGYIKVGTITTQPEGTAWWLTRVIDSTSSAVATGASESVYVRAVFDDYTPRDCALAAIVQRGFDGIYNAEDGLVKWTSELIRSVSGLRNHFNIHA